MQPSARICALFCGVSIVALAQTAPPRELVVDGEVVGVLVEPRRSEICLLCNEPLHAGDVVYQVQGQRVPIHIGPCDNALRANPRPWLARLKSRGAFLSADWTPGAISNGWFLAGLYILTGLIFAALCAHRALHTGHRPFPWFGAGLLFNAFGYLLILTRPRREVHALGGVPEGLGKFAATYAPEPCPRCGATNHPAGARCSTCGALLEPKVTSETGKVGPPGS